MMDKLRVRAQGESGFTLVELLVVMLILGLLAAIAIPAFFNQRDKANDAEAKAIAKTTQTAMETYATDNNGSYSSADLTALNKIEPTIPTTGTNAPALTPGASSYSIVVTADNTANKFTIARSAIGALSYTCTTGGKGGCPSTGKWD